jgi:hypothetical protein
MELNMRKTVLIVFCFSILSMGSFALAEENSQLPSKEEVFYLINSNQAERMTMITTTNPDGSAHASIIGIWVSNDLIHFRASSRIAVARNLQRTKSALITLYKIPGKGVPLKKHIGAGIRVTLVDDLKRDQTLKEGKNLKSIYSMKIVKIKSLQSEIDGSEEKGND